eukprot:gnl/Spiro4/12714_TR6740_c0_g1_i1.p1 gnl/Spiro4/12714_TR6740_c0_g1~~gnl/Spiro4/12714_TR6740_c0_g1_i1.p1  ORF type:complete len:307 (+),score=47.65 gnl/Spiro4/12714_TR6740_c0_g1_i1:108-923(+)
MSQLMRCVCLVFLLLVCVTASHMPKLLHEHTHIFLRRAPNGGLLMVGMPDPLDRSLASVRANAEQRAEETAAAEAARHYNSQRRVLMRAQANPFDEDDWSNFTDPNSTCKPLRTHMHFYMPHAGPVNPMMMLPFMHPGAMWNPMFSMGAVMLDVTDRSNKPDLDLLDETNSDQTPSSVQEMCQRTPQLHLHLYDPSSGVRNVQPAVHIPAIAPISPALRPYAIGYPAGPTVVPSPRPFFPYGAYPSYAGIAPHVYGPGGANGIGLHPLTGF